ncbi:hypothetical protein A0H76_2363 [Hepatospora eriocheir]|uniref:STAS domain-containing protein n=1 Tax=Hepatospora eriocheir TaxID=1081669 RepID=A0A1X0QFD7_9MICR|nr:hypothetical protein A0H76_2363 [Hepatospora eriocheir]
MITDVLSVGTAFFDLNLSEAEKVSYKECQDKLNELSYIIFNISMMLSTLIYTNFGSLKTFMIGSAVFESRSITSDIARTVFDYFIKQGVSKQNIPNMVLLNTYLVCCLFVIIVSLVYIIIYYSKIGNYLKKIPILAVNVIGGKIGISLMLLPISPIINNPSTNNLIKISIVAVSAVLIVLIETFLHFDFAIPCLLIGSCTVVYLFSGKINNEHRVDQLFLEYDFSNFKKIFNNSSIAWGVLLKCLPIIIKGVILCVILFTINIVTISSKLNASIDMNVEYLVNSGANFLSLFIGLPVYPSASYTIYLNSIGCKSKWISYATVITFLLFIVTVFKWMVQYIPVTFTDTVFVYVGISIFKSSVIDMVKVCSMFDITILTLGIMLDFTTELVGFFFTIAVVTSRILLEYIKNPISEKPKNTGDISIIKIDYILCYMTLDRFENDLRRITPDTLIDLNDCPFIDTDANLRLISLIKEKKINRLTGRPANFYFDKIAPLCQFIQ